MFKKNKLVVNVLICIMAVAIFVSSVISMEDKSILITDNNSEQLISSFDNYARKVSEGYNSGLAVALIEKGQIAFIKGYGYADKENGLLIQGDTAFQAASISKSVAAWGVMKLVEEGKIDLDAPVEKYLTRWSIPSSSFDTDKVTIRLLLSHTSGLSSHGYAGYEPDSTIPTLEESLLGKGKYLEPVKLVKEPGTAYKYSGGGYTVLQLMIEEVTGIPFSEYMQKEVLIPLGMNNSSYDYKVMQKKVAKSYGVFGEVLPGYIYTEEAAAGLYTTAEDLGKFVLASLSLDVDNDNKVLKPETIKLMQSIANSEFPFGLGYMEVPFEDGRRLLEHRGTNRGWRNKYIFSTDTKDGLVILTNNDNARSLANDVEMYWEQSKFGDISDSLKAIKQKQIYVLLAFLILAAGLLIYLSNTIFDIVGLNKKKSFYKPNSKKVKPLLISLLSAVFGSLWLILFYTGMFYKGWTLITFMPKGFNLLSIVIALWCSAICTTNIIKYKGYSKNTNNIKL